MRSPFRKHELASGEEEERKGNLGFDIPFSGISGMMSAAGLNVIKQYGKRDKNLLKGVLPLSALYLLRQRYNKKKDERAKSDVMSESFQKQDNYLNIKSVVSDPDLLQSMEGWERESYKKGKLSRHRDEYHSPWTTESMAHTQLDPREGHKIDDYSGEKDTRSISDMIRGELDILSRGDDNYLSKSFQNFKWLVENTKNTTKVNKVMGTKWRRDKSEDLSTITNRNKIRSFVGEALRYE